MDPRYKLLQLQADRLRYRMQDVVNRRAQQPASQLVQTARDIMEDIERSRAPRAVESRIERLKHLLDVFKATSTNVISPQAAGDMWNLYEDLRRRLRALPNY